MNYKLSNYLSFEIRKYYFLCLTKIRIRTLIILSILYLLRLFIVLRQQNLLLKIVEWHILPVFFCLYLLVIDVKRAILKILFQLESSYGFSMLYC